MDMNGVCIKSLVKGKYPALLVCNFLALFVQITYNLPDLITAIGLLSVCLLWPGDTIWRHKSWSTLARVMACCLMALSHYLNRCWRTIKGVLWHSPGSSFTRAQELLNPQHLAKDYTFKITTTSPRGQWVETLSYQLDSCHCEEKMVLWTSCLHTIFPILLSYVGQHWCCWCRVLKHQAISIGKTDSVYLLHPTGITKTLNVKCQMSRYLGDKINNLNKIPCRFVVKHQWVSARKTYLHC